ncbi:hypothetical protein [Radiobacillus sp. PE A8.2]
MIFRFIDIIAGTIYDTINFFAKPFSYLIAGGIIVAIPVYLIVWIFGLFQ